MGGAGLLRECTWWFSSASCHVVSLPSYTGTPDLPAAFAAAYHETMTWWMSDFDERVRA